ncbi:uncharacterized protein [Halyomorpha halys]|uniref:uncharacterized protein n=1 Tax=Halyomorpha halys TaxID=286706 RepID=UPI0006D4FA49|nr:uncharacterized protein LOC106691726 [Halyomorpha halys]
MDLGKGPRQPSMVVKKKNERAGKLSRTKYFIRIDETNKMPEIKEPITLPDGGFIVPMQVDAGSSDFMRPQIPSPGDIRRMYGSDKIDCEPEYARGMDPDWSRVSPTTPAELENKVREWNAATNAVLRKYRDIEEKRRQFDKKNKFSKVFKRTHSEGDKRKNIKSKDKELRLSSRGTHKVKKKHWRNWPRETVSSTASSVKSTDNGEVPRSRCLPNDNNTQEFLSSDGTIIKDEPERIPYIPKKIMVKSFNTAINVLQKMTSDHWIMIDKLYNDIKREKGINLDSLTKWVMKIVREIYGIESEFILATIHPKPVQRVIKLGKLMLNVYHEAMFGSRKKQKLLIPGINNKHFSQKCLQAYTFTPQYRTTRMTSKMYERLTASREKPPKCIACYKKNMERENTLQKKLEPFLFAKNNKQMKKKNIKSKRKASGKLPGSNIIKLNRPKSSSSSERQKYMKSNDRQNNTNPQKSQMMLYVPPFLAKEQDKEYPYDTSVDRTNESSLTLSTNEEKLVDELETPPSTSFEKMADKTDEDQAMNSSTGNLGGGDSLVQFSNDYNYLLSGLYESNSKISLELSKKLSASPIMATFGGTTEMQNTDRFFTSSANILQLNDQLEKMLFKQTREESSESFQDSISESDGERYIDCAGAEEQSIYTSVSRTNDQVEIQKKSYKYSKWMCITDECVGHRGYITFFMTIMLGLITAVFCHDSFLKSVNEDPTLKDSVKKVVKTFLLGALRLVDDF